MDMDLVLNPSGPTGCRYGLQSKVDHGSLFVTHDPLTHHDLLTHASWVMGHEAMTHDPLTHGSLCNRRTKIKIFY